MTLGEAKIKALEKALEELKRGVAEYNMEAVQEYWDHVSDKKDYTEDDVIVEIDFIVLGYDEYYF